MYIIIEQNIVLNNDIQYKSATPMKLHSSTTLWYIKIIKCVAFNAFALQYILVSMMLQNVGPKVSLCGLRLMCYKTLRAIRYCRRAALGGHVDACSNCGEIKISYNICRNRHCPKCQGHKRKEWMQKREAELLPVPYFHVVFTLPEEVNKLAMYKPALVYNTLFKASWATLDGFGCKHGMQGGMIGVLHTWGQTLSLHPHIHCIVPAGGVNAQGKWQAIRGQGKYLYPVKAMSKVYRAKYLALLREGGITDKALLNSLYAKEWVVYAKRPFKGPAGVLEYLGRYTHKVAISNHRIQEVKDDTVVFKYKDYRSESKVKEMELTHEEFTRRYAQHILPHGYVRIRHYGILSSTWKRKKLHELRLQFGLARVEIVKQTKLHCCPHCKTPTLITIEVFGKRGPPAKYLMGGTSTAC
jgi:Putative transposase/Transposase zinc-binding domain